ncbi:MAG: response regulator transcription factor [Marinilabiliaceae bacterium]|nr:response regulator transcription factor [Marinilabiliaceae bacterium]
MIRRIIKVEIISVAIADDHIIFRKGLATILNEIATVKVVAEASNGHELLDFLKTAKADVVLMDIKMPVMDGIEATRLLAERYPEIGVIALTMHEEIGYFNKMIEAGAKGFLLKKTNQEQLEQAITNVYRGENYFAEEFSFSVTKAAAPSRIKLTLTEREREVLEYICKGLSNSEISKKLGLSHRTIDGHRARLFEKTGAKNAPNLVMFAVKNGLIKP